MTYGASIGAVAQLAAGTADFVVESNPLGSVTYPIIGWPQVTVTAPTPTSTYTATPTSTPTVTQTYSVTPTYTITMTPVTGEGSAVISPSTVVSGSAGNIFTLDYTAGPSAWATPPGYGALKLTVPSGWPAPSTISASTGYFTQTLTGGTLAGKQVTGQDIKIFVSSLASGQKITIKYGDTSGGGPGITAPAGGTYTWRVESSLSGPSTNAIAVFPAVLVVTPTVTNTITPTMTITPTLTFTNTPNSTPVQPPAFTSQLNGANTTLSWQSSSGVDYYRIYAATGATGRLNPFPSGWQVIATVLPTPTACAFNDSNTDQFCFYRVSAVNGAGEGQPAPAAAKVKFTFGYTAGAKNTYRIGLPYNTGFTTASSIVTNIEGSPTTANKVDIIAIWNPAQQAYIAHSYVGSWKPPDWSVDAGTSSSNAIFVDTVSAFTWSVAGTDKSAPLYFRYYTGQANLNERMIPYSSAYAKASDIVKDIEGNTATANKIDMVAAFNPASQTYNAYLYNGSIWPAPSNFNINPGDVVLIDLSGRTNEFTWTPKLAGTPVP